LGNGFLDVNLEQALDAQRRVAERNLLFLLNFAWCAHHPCPDGLFYLLQPFLPTDVSREASIDRWDDRRRSRR
jgi:hypothetical protein